MLPDFSRNIGVRKHQKAMLADVCCRWLKKQSEHKNVRPVNVYKIKLSHNNFNFVSCALIEYGQDIAVYLSAVNSYSLYALANVVGVLDCDVIGVVTELSCQLETVPCLGDRWVYLQTVIVGYAAQDEL